MKKNLMAFLNIVLLLILFRGAPGQAMDPISVAIDNAGLFLKGRLFVAPGAGPHAMVILLPGFPGGEGDVLGIGARLAAAGYNALTFNYSGSYGSQGEMSWPNAQRDITAALAFALRPENAEKYRTDAKRIVLGGWCFGGGMALGYAAGHPEVTAVFSIAGNDHGEFLREYVRNPEMKKLVDGMVASWIAPPLGVRMAKGAMPMELVAAGLDRLNPIFDLRASAPRLAGKEILLVGGWNDRQVTIDQYILPFYRALEKAGAKNVTITAFQDDHYFKKSGEPLARTIIDWLKSIQAIRRVKKIPIFILNFIKGRMAMKTIGLLGGITCESSLLYYKLINEITREKLGGHHAAKSVMVSVDFAQIQPLTESGDWEGVLAILLKAAKGIERGGADLLLLCANTAHKLADEIAREIGIPIVHIVDATAREIKKAGLTRVGLLGTRFTMEEDFFKGRLCEKYGIEALVPAQAERQRVHRIIIDELALGNIRPESREAVNKIMDGLIAAGAQAIILGCTELPLLITREQSRAPLFDTTMIHARAAVDWALEPGDARI